MQCLVDGGEIIPVQAKSPREAAWLAMTELGARARFPLTVHVVATGEQTMFIRDEPEVERPKPPRAVGGRRKALRRKSA